jgi:hypothetical protein
VGTSAVARKNRPDETPRETSRPTPPQRTVNGGKLNSGNPGNRGGGRPPSVLREVARDGLADALPRLRLVAMGEAVRQTRVVNKQHVDVEVRPTIAESLEAVDRLESLGLGAELRAEDITRRLEAQAEVICQTLGAEDAERVLAAIATVWR